MTPENPRRREVVSVLGQMSRYREAGQGWWETVGIGGTASPCGPLQGLLPRVHLGAPLNLLHSGSQSGRGAGSRDLRLPVRSLQAVTLSPEPFWAALPAKPHVSSRMCGDPGEGHQGTIVICSPWLVRGRSFGVWDSPVPSFYPRGTRFLLSFPSLESRVSNPELYLPRLTLPTTGSKSLNFQDPSHIPKANSLSSVHSIFINYLSFVVCFKQTSYFNCLFFLCRVASGSLLNIYICCVYFPWEESWG